MWQRLGLSVMLSLLPVVAEAAPPYRYYLSPIIGSGTTFDAYRVAIESLVSGYAAIIPSKPDGTPRFSWGLAYVPYSAATRPPPHIPIPTVLLSEGLGLTTLQRTTLQAVLDGRGVALTLSTVTTLESVVDAIGKRLEPSFSVEHLFAGNRPGPRGQGNTVLFADTFTNAAVSISTAGGEYGLWSSKEGLFSIANNELIEPNPYVNPKTLINLTSLTTADYYVGADARVNPNGNRDVGVYGRMSDAPASTGTSYYAQIIGTGNALILFKNVAGVTTNLATWGWTTDTNYHRLVLGMIGTTISVRWDDLVSAVRPFEVISLSDSAIAASGYAGVRMNGAQVPNISKIDNFCIATTTAEVDVVADCVIATAAAAPAVRTAPGVVIGEPGMF